jgi:hypothetical protein
MACARTTLAALLLQAFAACARASETDTLVQPSEFQSGEPMALEDPPEERPVWRDPQVFAARAREQADSVESAIAREVRHGRAPICALDEVRARRAYLEGVIAMYRRDGVIHREEKRHVDILLARMRGAGESCPGHEIGVGTP